MGAGSEPVIYKTQEQLEEGVAVWQRLLGLRDWTVKATLAHPDDFESEDAQGECNVNEGHRSVRIWILAEEFYSPHASFPQDQEHTLAHELLHVHFEPLRPVEYDRRVEVATEQAINAIADGLVKLRRAGLVLKAGFCA